MVQTINIYNNMTFIIQSILNLTLTLVRKLYNAINKLQFAIFMAFVVIKLVNAMCTVVTASIKQTVANKIKDEFFFQKRREQSTYVVLMEVISTIAPSI